MWGYNKSKIRKRKMEKNGDGWKKIFDGIVLNKINK